MIFALYKFGVKSAFIVSLMRVFISFLLFGSVLSLAYSFSGAIFSITVMSVMKKIGKFSEIGVSVAGATAHNIAQILVAILIFSVTEILFYLPVLMISAVISGIFIGIAGAVTVRRIKMK